MEGFARDTSCGQQCLIPFPAGSQQQLESLARDILPDGPASSTTTPASPTDDKSQSNSAGSTSSSSDVEVAHNRTNERRVLIKKLRKTVLLGAAGGILLAICIGAAFLAVFYTQSNDLYGKAEEVSVVSSG